MFGLKKKAVYDPATDLQNQHIVNSITQGIRGAISSALGNSEDGSRNIYENFKYPAHSIDFNSLYWQSRRNGMANRITHGIAKSCWRNGYELHKVSESTEKKEAIFSKELKLIK